MTENRINLLKTYIEEDPKDPFNIYVLALEYVKSGMHTEALKQFENLHASHSNYLPLYYQFGQLLEQLNQKEEAIKIYLSGESLAQQQSNIKTLNELKSARELLED